MRTAIKPRNLLSNLAPFALLLPIVVAALLLKPVSPCLLSGVSNPGKLAAKAPDFSVYRAGNPRKEAFVDYFLPIIRFENRRILDDRRKLLCLREQASLSVMEQRWLKKLARHYRMAEFTIADASDWAELLVRVDAVPASLALAQGANESAWGTSRFAREGNNFFGQWCFQPGCGIVPKRRPAGAKHEVAVFKSPQLAVRSYLRNLNSHPKYQPLRSLRIEQGDNRQGAGLARGLLEYSSRREAYIDELQNLIQQNQWAGYDRPPGDA